ncbi:ACT domain-containing protein [Clostridium sp. OS1-26]|uniref:ACT domain-containing protein n=1 Tax=Clostridium sp. OS1-26 TaxID=3070681 RepID=UPI0027DF19C0|nr:ACT domain-containing protein [Clostridium sp. OS1-26]WML37632.1 ACT domain-containing protein [Clostridium sp. OS1-26]
MKAFVSVLGKDKVGIIHEVTSVLSKNNVNILDINQTLIDDYFTMVMLVDLSKMQLEFKDLKTKFENKAAEIDVSIKVQREDIFNSMYKI